MANDERQNEEQEEREFLAGLKVRTGRGLAEWMAAIAARGSTDKNEIIDWLRSEGLPFARASWLERIHRNGGKPIHAGSPAGLDSAGPSPGEGGQTVAPSTPAGGRPAAAPPRLVVVASTPRPAPAQTPLPPAPPRPSAVQAVAASPPVQAAPVEPAAARTELEPEPARKPAKKASKPPPRIEPSADPAALEKLISAAKGYRPLYHHLEAQIRRAIPATVLAARERYVAIGAPLEFAVVTLHPTDIRLGLALGDRPFDAQLLEAKVRGAGAHITHMLVLTDARQVNEALLALLQAAKDRVNPAAG